MGWFSGIGDALSGIGDAVTGFIEPNKGWLTPVADAIGGFAKDQQRGSTAGGIANIYDQIERNRRAEADAMNQYAYQNNLAMAQQSAANSAASAAAGAARAGAARATEANRQKALKKSLKAQRGQYELAKGYLDPYVKEGHALLPKITQTYGAGLDSLNTLNNWFMKPDMLKLTQGFTPAASVNIPLPERLKKGD